MLRAVERSAAGGAGATVIIGADTPTLPAQQVLDAFSALEGGANVVVSPAADGGYVLIGLDRPRPELFRAIAWGGARVAATTLARASALGLDVAELAGWYDVDELDDLRRLGRELALGARAARAPRTAALLARGGSARSWLGIPRTCYSRGSSRAAPAAPRRSTAKPRN
jgi:glycosyltransferase A (GT-A) superfamily protein (DUF2064 family)